MIAIDLSKQQELHSDSKAIQQVNFTGNLNRAESSTLFLCSSCSFRTIIKNVLIPLRLRTAASATDAAIHKKMVRSGFATLIISNEEINGMKIVKSLEESGLFIKGISETMKNEAKEQKRGFLAMLLGTLGVSLLRNLLTDKGTIRVGDRTIRAGENV